jgi:hypothetical protein
VGRESDLLVKLRDKVSGDVTEGYLFDGTDEGMNLRNALANSLSVTTPASEIVVGSSRLYLPQSVPSLAPGQPDEFEFEIVERGSWVIWNEDDEQWGIYPQKLKERYFEELPDDKA